MRGARECVFYFRQSVLRERSIKSVLCLTKSALIWEGKRGCCVLGGERCVRGGERMCVVSEIGCVA